MLNIRKEFRMNKYQQVLLDQAKKEHKSVYKEQISEGRLLRFAIEMTYGGDVSWKTR